MCQRWWSWGDGCAWWEAAFGEVAVPLGDRGVRFVGEVEAADQFAVLPAAVGRLGAASEEVGAVRGVADPFAGDGDGIDVERHVLGDAGVRELGDELGDATVVAAGEQREASRVNADKEPALRHDSVKHPQPADAGCREFSQPIVNRRDKWRPGATEADQVRAESAPDAGQFAEFVQQIRTRDLLHDRQYLNRRVRK
jgi:hypothetical protein